MSDRENNGEEKMVVHVVIPIKLPLFSKANPNLWFARAEMLLDGDRIVSDASRFRQVVKCLDDEILDLVSDILAPPAANKYQTLKNHIVGLFRESEDERTQRFLRGEGLHNERPTVVLQRLRNLAGPDVPDRILKSMFLSLPSKHATVHSRKHPRQSRRMGSTG